MESPLSVKLSMNLLEFWIRHMRIDLCGGYGSMTKKFLNRTNIGTVGEEGSGETMSERMSGNLFDNIRSKRILLDFIGDKKSREPHIGIGQRGFYSIISVYGF